MIKCKWLQCEVCIVWSTSLVIIWWKMIQFFLFCFWIFLFGIHFCWKCWLLPSCFHQRTRFYLMKKRERIMICMGIRRLVLDLMLAIHRTMMDILTSQVVVVDQDMVRILSDLVNGRVWGGVEAPSHFRFPLVALVVQAHLVLAWMIFFPTFLAVIQKVGVSLVVLVVQPGLNLGVPQRM